MGINRDKLRQLAERMAAVVEDAPQRPALRSVPERAKPAHTLDWIVRESHMRMIRHLTRRYGMQVLVDQALFGYASLDDLPDDDLKRLHSDLHRAFECLSEGISLEDAGLIRQRSEGEE